MKTKSKTFVVLAGCIVFFAHAVSAQESSTSGTLDAILYRTVCERVQAPLVFSTRDTLFALSLPADEPAEIYLQLTVGKNGKVKDKLTKVHANHIANYVAPAFAAATEELRIDRKLLAGMQGKDTSLILTFPMEYQCVLDTISKEWPSAGDKLQKALYRSFYYDGTYTDTPARRELYMQDWALSALWIAERNYRDSFPTPIWYYLAFVKEP